MPFYYLLRKWSDGSPYDILGPFPSGEEAESYRHDPLDEVYAIDMRKVDLLKGKQGDLR